MSDAGALEARDLRTCGACNACCTVLAVREIEKATHQRCAHLAPSGQRGCAIYDARPAACQGYRCAWLDGNFGGRPHRPDRLGVIVDTAGQGAVVVREAWPGAFARRAVKRGLVSLHGSAKAQGLVVRLVPFAGRRLPLGAIR